MTMEMIATFGWVIALVLWAITLYVWFKPEVSLEEVAEELFWIVEQIDEISEGSIKGESKWIIYRNLLLLISRIVRRVSKKMKPEEVEELGRGVVKTLLEKKAKKKQSESESEE